LRNKAHKAGVLFRECQPGPRRAGQQARGVIQRPGGVRRVPGKVYRAPQEQAQGWILNARRLVREVLVARAVEEHVVRLESAGRGE